MKNVLNKKVIVILGSTASGKTKLAVRLAQRFNGEIISADSRQVYRGMDIGTGKDLKEYGAIPYHAIDIVSPRTRFTVEQYQRRAYRTIDDILRRGKLPILVGGTGLYISAVVDGYQFPATASRKKQDAIRKRLDKKTLAMLLQELRLRDLATHNVIDKKNRRRVQRAVEIYYLSGRKKSDAAGKNQPDYQFLQVGLRPTNDMLRRRISLRLQQRLAAGMVAEVRRLHRAGLSWRRLEDFGLEYRWIALHLQKKISRGQMVAGLDRAIRQYARRQMTWFKRDKRIIWVTGFPQAHRNIHDF